MPTLAVASLRHVTMGPAIIEYLERIDATLEPFGGRFLVHGGPTELLEGAWSGDLVMIQFPDRDRARRWYHSAAYQAILPLRRDNSECDALLIDTVPEDHQATDILAQVARV